MAAFPSEKAKRFVEAMRVRASRLLAPAIRVLRQEWRRLALALGFAIFALLAGGKVLQVHPAPQDRPPKIVALPPANAPHGGKSGYVISASLTVDSCSSPVSGFLTVVLPREFFEGESSLWGAPLHRALFAAAFSDPAVEVTFIGPDSSRFNPNRSLYSWSSPFSDPEHVDASGTVAAARFDGWDEHPDALSVFFKADWLKPRGYGSCWLPTPELVGDLQTFAVNASDQVSRVIGPKSGAEHLSTGGEAEGVIVRKFSDGRVEKHKSSKPFAWDYVNFLTPPSLGFVDLNTPMSVLPSESVGPPPSVGTPTWACEDDRGGSESRIRLYGMGQDGDFRWIQNARLREYKPPEASSHCDSWVALAEPGSQSKRDLWLLVIGAALSASVALLVDLALPARKRRRRGS